MRSLRRYRRILPLLCLIGTLGLLVTSCGLHRTRSGGSESAAPPTAGADTSSSAATGIPAGRSTRTMAVGGARRTVHLYRPAGLSGAAPLVVMLHGGYGSGTQAEDSYHWDPEADSGHFLLALPDGLNSSWNAGGGCCGRSAKQNVDDVTFLTRMVSALRHDIGIDSRRIYIAGISNGGVMAYRMACETDLFAAVGVDSTTMLVPCGSAQPTSVLHIHGTADPNIPYQGGTGHSYSLTGSSITTPPIPTVNADWRATDQCPVPDVSTHGVLTTSVAQCPDGRTVELITIAGAGHQWPGGDANPRAEKLFHTGAPSTALNATQTIWQFFATHTK